MSGPLLEDAAEDYGQIATYLGTLPGSALQYALDDDTRYPSLFQHNAGPIHSHPSSRYPGSPLVCHRDPNLFTRPGGECAYPQSESPCP